MKYLITFLLLTGIALAQNPIQPYKPKFQPQPFFITTQTTWDRDHWVDGVSPEVAVWATTQATMCLDAPNCSGGCQDVDCREGKLYLVNQALPRQILQCPREGQCCVTYHWVALQGERYFIKATNHTARLDCGPTKVRVLTGLLNCEFE